VSRSAEPGAGLLTLVPAEGEEVAEHFIFWLSGFSNGPAAFPENRHSGSGSLHRELRFVRDARLRTMFSADSDCPVSFPAQTDAEGRESSGVRTCEGHEWKKL